MKSRPRIGPLLKDDGSYTSSDSECAEVLGQYFASVYQVETFPVPVLQYRTHARLDSVDFSHQAIVAAIKRTKRWSSPGTDGIPTVLLQECCDTLAPYFEQLFQDLLSSRTVPPDWLEARVVPIHKQGSIHQSSNFRPISLTSSPGKTMESVVAKELLEYAKTNDLFYASQFGFLPGRSCMTQLLEFVTWITTVINDADCADVVYLDLKKAFDRVPKLRLLAKLQSYGISGDLLGWICSFLSDRTQFVVINDSKSAPYSVTSGVPQGSVLGPILFLYYINDVDDWVSSSIWKYADDTKLGRRLRMSDPRLYQIDIDDMQFDLDSIYEWSQVWLMDFNVQKCACLHFGNNNPTAIYHLNGCDIPNKTSEKDLGVTISSNLKFSDHCAKSVRSAEGVLWCIRRCIKYMSKDIFLRLYKALVRPRLEYASSVWCPHYVRDVDIIERVQHHATKLFLPVRDLPYEERLRRLGIQSLKTRRLRSDLILLYRMCHGKVDIPITNLFQWARDDRLRGHPFKLRAAFTPRLDCARYTFAYRVVDTWNRLPESVVTAPSIATFKNRLHRSVNLPDL
jgi:hypothetical protein